MRWRRVALILALASACGRTSADTDETGADPSGGMGGVAGGPSSVHPPTRGGTGTIAQGGMEVAGAAGSPTAGGEAAGGEGGSGGPADCETREACTGVVDLGLTFGEQSDSDVHDLAVRPDGQVAVALAAFDAQVDFGPPTLPLVAVGGWDAIVASFTSELAPLWATLVGTVDEERYRGVSFDANGSLAAVGVTIDDNANAVLGARLTRFDGAGTPEWLREFYFTADGSHLTTADDGTMVATGTFTDAVDFDGHVVDGGDTAGQHVFIARFDAQGTCIWAQQLPSTLAVPAGVALDSAGNVVVAGTFSGFIDYMEGNASSLDGSADLFLARFHPDGDILSFDIYPSNGIAVPRGLALDSDDNIVLAGSLDGQLTFGATTIENTNAIFLAKLAPNGLAGGLTWARSFRTSLEGELHDLALDPFDNLLVAGHFRGKFNTPVAIGANDRDGFVIKMTPDGAVRWVTEIKGIGEQAALAVGADGDGNVYTAGRYFDSIDFGDGPQSGFGYASHFFLARIAP